MKEIRKLIREIIYSKSEYFYHGTRSLFPFQTFDPKLDSTGIVSSGSKKFGGVFFTSVMGNAEFYSEYFICKVKIYNLEKNPTTNTHPPTVLKQGIQDGESYVVEETLDGDQYSDIAIVPHSNLDDVHILEWIFGGDKEFYFEYLDEFFGGDSDPNDEDNYDDEGNLMEPYIDQGMIESFIRMTGGELDYLLNIPVFKEYYDLKI